MTVLAFNSVTKAYDPHTVLRECSWEVHKGDKVGLVGANGAGKTTVFRLLLGLEQPDSGRVSVGRGLKLGYLPQQPGLVGPRTVLEEVRTGLEEVLGLERRLHELSEQMSQTADEDQRRRLVVEFGRVQARFEAAGGYRSRSRLEATLLGLGLPEAAWSQPVASLSGGQKCRVALARLLVSCPDVLLLDEPSNHLDIEATDWLERFLVGFPGTIVLVSHDRCLLDRVVSKIAELEHGRIETYLGNYSAYAAAREQRLTEAWNAYRKQQSFLARQQALIERYTGSRKSRLADSRRRQVDRLQRSGVFRLRPRPESQGPAIDVRDVRRSGDLVVRLDGVSKRYGDRVLFDNLSLEITRGQKVGLIGPNGCGKTTLLKVMLGLVEPDQGACRLGAGLTVGYYDQSHADLDPGATVIDEVWSMRPPESGQAVRAFLARFLFTGDTVFKTVGECSGGEQSRVVLAKLFFARPNWLVLDEPTNHLDIPARQALEEALRDFPGTLVLVTHDRYLLDRVVQRLVVFGKDRLEVFEGSYSAYADRCRLQEAQASSVQARREAETRSKGRPSQAGARARKKVNVKAALAKLEAEIIGLEERLGRIEADFARPEVSRDGQKMKALRREHDELRARLASLNAEWEALADASG